MTREDIIKKVDLTRTNYGEVRLEKYAIALLPWGATEPHNLHLPYLTDCLLSHAIGVEAAIKTWAMGVHTMVLPPVPYGAQNPGQRKLPFCIHGRYQTQYAILSDVVASLRHQGLRKLAIINGHGGNGFKNMIRDLALDFPDFQLLAGDWWKAAPEKEYFDEPGDHAGELETSAMMHFYPELVRLEEAGRGDSATWALATLREGVAWMPRDWQQISRDTGVGNPSRATSEKGRRFAEACAEKWAQLLVELANSDQLYQSISNIYTAYESI